MKKVGIWLSRYSKDIMQHFWHMDRLELEKHIQFLEVKTTRIRLMVKGTFIGQ